MVSTHRERRVRLGISRRQLASASGISERVIERIEMHPETIRVSEDATLSGALARLEDVARAAVREATGGAA